MSIVRPPFPDPAVHTDTDVGSRHMASASYEQIAAALMSGSSGAVGQFGEYRLRSVYQPIVSPALRRPIGYEALLRAETADGRTALPREVFAGDWTVEQTVFLDRACRALHARNFKIRAPENTWLFLNVNPRVVVDGRAYGSFFAGMLESTGMPPGRVVIEILESAIADEALLGDTVGYYKELGCLVAIDDFGAGQSNFDRIVRLEPDLVKIDRGLIVHARDNRLARRLLPNMVSMLHEAGCLVVLEGIEDYESVLLSLDTGADFLQGYFFGRPHDDPGTVPPPPDFGALSRQVQARHADARQEHERELAPYHAAFGRAAAAYAEGASLETAAAELIGRSRGLHAYVLDCFGLQLGGTWSGDGDLRFSPLHDTVGADWSRRPFFRSAVASPGEIQVTRPFLSSTSARLCITLSIALKRGGELQIFCFDLDWDLPQRSTAAVSGACPV